MPASVGESRRVDRTRRRTPNLSSNPAIVLEIAGWPILRSRAAAEKEPVSTTLTNVSISCSRPISIPVGNRFYHSRRSSICGAKSIFSSQSQSQEPKGRKRLICERQEPGYFTAYRRDGDGAHYEADPGRSPRQSR